MIAIQADKTHLTIQYIICLPTPTKLWINGLLCAKMHFDVILQEYGTHHDASKTNFFCKRVVQKGIIFHNWLNHAISQGTHFAWVTLWP